MKIYIGSDHRGFPLKEKVREWLIADSYSVEDMGAYELNPDDDYTEFAQKVASVVGDYYTGRIQDGGKKHTGVRGILFCGSGVGVDIVANKFDGVRASIGLSSEQVKAGRTDDDMNVLVIASDFTDEEKVQEMITVFLEIEFDGKSRHVRRLEEIEKIEKSN